MAPTEPPLHASAGSSQEAEILEGPSTLQKTRGHQPDAMEMVRDLQARIEVKKEAMEEEQHEHAQRHAQLQSVVEAKIQEAAELRGRLNDIALAFECTLCFEKLGAGSVSFGCGHTYCNRATCGSRLVDTCPECRLPVASRVQLFGALPDVGGLLEQEPAAPGAEQVQRLASENGKASLEEIRKRSEEDKAFWQREKKDMQQQANRLQDEVLAAANAKATLEEIRKWSEEDKAVWQREREAMQQQVNRLQEEVLAAANAKASLEEIRKRSEEEKAVWQREREEMQQQVNRLQGRCWHQNLLAAANAKATLEEIRKRSEEDKAVWQREREEMQQQVCAYIYAGMCDKAVWQREREAMQQQVNRLQEEVLAAANAKASLEEIRKRSEEDKAVLQREREAMQQQVNRLQEEVLAAANAKASLEEIRRRSEEDKAVWQREREEMQQQVNRLQEEVLAAANANASLEEIRVQQNDHINTLLKSEKMRSKQVTPELDAERLGKKDELPLNVAEQTKKRLSDGDKEQNAVPLPASPPPNKKQKQNMSGKACDADNAASAPTHRNHYLWSSPNGVLRDLHICSAMLTARTDDGQTIFEAKDKDPLFKQVLPELNDKCQRGTIIPLFNPELNETMVAKRWSFVIKYVKDTAGNISDAPLDLRDLLQTIHSSLAESIATKNEKLAKKKRLEKERRERGKVAEQRVTDSPTTTSSVKPAQVHSFPRPSKPRDMVTNMYRSIENILSLVKTTLEPKPDTPTPPTSDDHLLRLEQEKTKQLEVQLELAKMKHLRQPSNT